MTDEPAALRSGKGHRDENFPVASRLIHPRYRAPILAFYNFVRTADDIADHAALPESRKLELLEQMETGLLGRHDAVPEAVALRSELRQRGLSPRHAQDLLIAFRMDVTKLRYQDWEELMNYCTYSAMPVGRFVLDVHGEERSLWPANDALCAALQIVNHLQDCALDYRNLNRSYLPLDAVAAAGARIEDLGAAAATPELRNCIRHLALRTGRLLDRSTSFSPGIKDFRLGMEVAVIQSLARRLVTILMNRDPLSERVHLGKRGMLGVGLVGIAVGMARRIGRILMPSQSSQNA